MTDWKITDIKDTNGVVKLRGVWDVYIETGTKRDKAETIEMIQTYDYEDGNVAIEKRVV